MSKDNTGRNVAIGAVLLLLLLAGASASAKGKGKVKRPVSGGKRPPLKQPKRVPIGGGRTPITGGGRVPVTGGGRVPITRGPNSKGELPSEDPAAPKTNVRDDPSLGELVKDYPTPGSFYQVVKGDMFGGESGSRSIVFRALLSAGFLAAQEVGGLGVDGAQDFARAVAGNAQNRVKYRDMIQCSGWNDILYGTYGYGTDSAKAPSGRAIRLLPRQDDVLDALRRSEGATDVTPPTRTIPFGKKSDQGTGSALGDFTGVYELLWLPAVNLTRLWESRDDDRQVITSKGLMWDTGGDGDAVLQSLPPPWVLEVGIETIVDISNPPSKWGCGEGSW